MIDRPLVARAAAALVAVGALAASTGCATFSGNDAAAMVGGAEISRDDFEATLQALAAAPEQTSITEDFATNSVAGDVGRNVLSALVTGAASRRFLEDAGEAVTDADRQPLLESIPEDDPLRAMPDDVFDLIVDLQAAGAARGRVGAAGAQARYEESPADLGVMCVRHIVVETEGEALAVLDELEAGADFAALAAQRSIEPAAAQTGGALADPQTGQPCLPLATASQSLDPAFVAGAIDARPGEPTAPVQSPFGFHIILARPFDEVADVVATAAGSRLFAEYLATADITIDPRYGRWDGEATAVVALAS